MVPAEAVLAAALLWCTYLTWWANRCRCEKCSFHVNEDRMARAKQADLSHETEHKGFAWREGDPDRYMCRRPDCDRNPK